MSEATLDRIEGRTCHASDGRTSAVPDFLEVVAADKDSLPDPAGTSVWILCFPVVGGEANYGFSVAAGDPFDAVDMAVGMLRRQRDRMAAAGA